MDSNGGKETYFASESPIPHCDIANTR